MTIQEWKISDDDVLKNKSISLFLKKYETKNQIMNEQNVPVIKNYKLICDVSIK